MKRWTMWYWLFCATFGGIFALIGRRVFAAETLPAVSPPTDWTGVLIVCGFGLLLALALAIGYAIHARRTPGMQIGEEAIERMAILLAEMMKQKPTPRPPTTTQPPAKFPADWN